MGHDSKPVVSIKDGKLMGRKGVTCNGSPYYLFKGIPYAKPPVGELRFMLPTSETDVLNLPVLFWIHGGGFVGGNATEDFNGVDYLMERDVLVVAVGYRLGPFGFLSLDTPNAPGNAGLKDQVQALRWVRDNVSKFGGNPNRVTVYGVSAGGASAHLLTLSPLARGLLHGAIAGSGNGVCDWALTTQHVERAKEFAEIFGIEARTPEGIAAALKKIPALKMVQGLLEFKILEKQDSLVTALPFVPSLELPSSGAFLSEHPEKILMEGKQAPVPLISGVSNREGVLWFIGLMDLKAGSSDKVLLSGMKMLNEHREKFIPPDLYKALSADERKELGDRIVEFYCGSRGICEETTDHFIDLVGDSMFIIKFCLACRLHNATSPAPVYTYRFTFDGRLGALKTMLKDHPYRGTGHSDEVAYLFPLKVLPCPPVKRKEPEYKVRENFITVIVNFVKTGKPVGANSSISWEPITDTNMSYLEMNYDFEMRNDKFGPRLLFWDGVYRKYLNKPLLV